MSGKTLKRILAAARHRWKRVRRSLKKKREEDLFRAAQAELNELRERLQGGAGEFELWYFDEAGFSLTPSVPYAWQPIGERIELESSGSSGQRQNVLGFLRWDGGDFYCAAFEGRIDSSVVGGCFREFAGVKKSAKPKLIVLDNAPIHRSARVCRRFGGIGETRSVCDVFARLLAGVEFDRNIVEENQIRVASDGHLRKFQDDERGII